MLHIWVAGKSTIMSEAAVVLAKSSGSPGSLRVPNHARTRAPQIADLLSLGFMQFLYFTPSHFTNVKRTLAGPAGQIRQLRLRSYS